MVSEAVVVLPGEPVIWARAQHRGRASYTDPRVRAWQTALACVAASARPKGWPLDALYRVTAVVTRSTRRRYDIDNAIKGALDACNGVLWKDDSQVWELHVEKRVWKTHPVFSMTAEVMP